MSDALVLGFDTSGPYCAAALVTGDTVLEALAEDMARGQAEALMGLLEDLLHRHGCTWKDLHALGVGVGPGNFTGIRIAVSAARGLALGLGIPAHGINGFEQRAFLMPARAVLTIPAPRDHAYVQMDGTQDTQSLETLASLGHTPSPEPRPADLACAVALVAASRDPQTATAPAPYYMRAADAAPARDAPPVILP